MKYGILISDLTIDQARTMLNDLGGVSAPANIQPFLSPSNIIGVATPSHEDDEGTDDGNPLDASGLPWDGRIHASTKRKTAKGMWQKRKGVQDIEVTNVEAELRSHPQQPTAPAAPSAPMQLNVPTYGGTPTAPQAPASAPVAPYVPQAPAPMAPPVPALQIAAPVAPTRDFQGLTQQLSNLFKGQRIAHDYPNTIVARVNQGFQINTVTSITDLANDPNMVEYAWQCLDVDGNAA